MNTQHTPGPWTEIPANGAPAGYSFTILHNMDPIADIPDGENDEANAQFIVRACNCHEDLLAACRALMAYVDSTGWGDLALSGTGDKGKDTLAEAAVVMARAAIAKAIN